MHEKRNPTLPGRLTGLLVGVAALGMTGNARADFLWLGFDLLDNDWSNAANWDFNGVPVGSIIGDPTIIFGFEAVGGDFLITGAVGVSDILVMSFTTANGSYVIDGAGPFTFQGGGLLNNDSLFDQTLNVPLVGSGGGLFLSATTGGLTLGGTIDLSDTGGTLLSVAGNFDTVIDGVISGAGGTLVKVGSGTLTLNGNNTYDGVTTAFAGKIILGHDNALGTGLLNIVGGLTLESDDDARNIANDITVDFVLTVAGANDLELSGNIDGGGGITKRGAATLLLSGTSTNSGAVRIDEGLLQVMNGDAIGDMATVNLNGVAEFELLDDETIGSLQGGGVFGGNVNLNANTLTIGGSVGSLFSGVLFGTGVLEVAGTGAMLLDGVNTYSGGSLISGAGGTLGAGHDQAFGTGDITLAAADATILAFGGSRTIGNDLTVMTTTWGVSGNDAIEFTGSVDLTGLSTRIDVTNTAGVEFSGILSNGGLRKIGVGTLTLSGVNTYTGDTLVNGGTLMLPGSLAGDAIINNSGVLGGTGTVFGDVTVNDGGTLSPGDGIGTFNIGGDFDLQTGGTLNLEVNAESGASDLVRVTGQATLGNNSTLLVSVGSPDFIIAGQRFLVVEADGGVFDDGAIVDTMSLTLEFRLEPASSFMDGDTSYFIQANREGSAFSDAAVGGNNFAVGLALDSLIPVANNDPTGEAGDLLALLDMITNDVVYNQALHEMSPETYAVTTSTGIETTTEFTSTQVRYLESRRRGRGVRSRRVGLPAGALASADLDPRLLAAAVAAAQADDDERDPWEEDEESPIGAYGMGFAVISDADQDGNFTGYDADTFGAQGGIDWEFNENVLAGIVLGYSRTEADYEGHRGGVDIDTFRVGPYASFSNGDGGYFETSITYGASDYDATRKVRVLGLEAEADYDGYDITSYFGVGYNWRITNTWSLTPNLAVQYTYFDFDGYTEKGAVGANLDVDSRDANSFWSRLGLTLGYEAGDGGVFDVTLGWQQQYLDEDDIDATFTAGGNPFSVDNGSRDDTMFYVGAGLGWIFENTTRAYVRYEGVFGDTTDISAFHGGVSITF